MWIGVRKREVQSFLLVCSTKEMSAGLQGFKAGIRNGKCSFSGADTDAGLCFSVKIGTAGKKQTVFFAEPCDQGFFGGRISGIIAFHSFQAVTGQQTGEGIQLLLTPRLQ